YDLSRISRSVRDTLSFIDDTVKKYGIDFVSIREQINTETPSGIAFLSIAAVFAELYRNEVAFRVAAAIKFKQSKHEYTGGHVPFGYVLNADHSVPMLADTEQQQAVMLMTKMSEEGIGLRGICSELHRQGYRTVKGGRWHPKVVRGILRRISRLTRCRLEALP
ncbi:MAG: hypothetical protein EOP09_12105, partial [Proteobacteria bacterium]